MSAKKKPRKRLIGYARICTKQQDLARQIKVLKRAGCDPIRSDTASGTWPDALPSPPRSMSLTTAMRW
jgi:predicted site-specific integrase-resolvase